MIELWEIREAPIPKDPHRGALYVKAAPEDIQKLIRKLGAACGRPQEAQTPFTHLLYIRNVNPQLRKKLEQFLPAKAPSPAPSAPAAPGKGLASWTMPFPDLRFDDFYVAAFNRLAHAAATSVVENPGGVYNPMFVFGEPAVGKTHLLTTIASELKASWKGKPLLVTQGARVSLNMARAVRAKTWEELSKKLYEAEALLVDDVHLLCVLPENRGPLGRLFRDFLSRKKQVVMTSSYPPKGMGALEEVLGIRFNQGWVVEVKRPLPDLHCVLLKKIIERSGLEMNEQTVESFLKALAPGLEEGFLNARRLSAWPESVPAPERVSLLSAEGALKPGKSSKEPSRQIGAACFYPEGHKEGFRRLVSDIEAAAAGAGAPVKISVVSEKAYSASQMQGLAFLAAEAALDSGAGGVLFLGPSSYSSLRMKENEFFHALRHVLEAQDMRTGLVSFQETSSQSARLKAALDLRL